MPQPSGYEVCSRLRATPWGSDTLLIALTGWGQPEDRRRTAEAGFDLHLVKPVDPADLQHALASTREEHIRGRLEQPPPAGRRGEGPRSGQQARPRVRPSKA
jgi:CheY-like chemotaxis protein